MVSLTYIHKPTNILMVAIGFIIDLEIFLRLITDGVSIALK